MIIAVLATFSITVTLFGILPTRSSSVNPYDPWLDFNDDGVINMRDIGATVNAFGTYGDPTKNVNVTNWPQRWKEVAIVEDLNITWNTIAGRAYSDIFNLSTVSTEGCSDIKFFMKVTNMTNAGPANNIAEVDFDAWGVHSWGEFYYASAEIVWNDQSYGVARAPTPPGELLRVEAPAVRITVQGQSYTPYEPIPPTISCLVSIYMYTRND